MSGLISRVIYRVSTLKKKLYLAFTLVFPIIIYLGRGGNPLRAKRKKEKRSRETKGDKKRKKKKDGGTAAMEATMPQVGLKFFFWLERKPVEKKKK